MIFDVVFIIDSTGSMGNLINTAKRSMKEIVSRIQSEGIDARYSLLSFRDHPPNEPTWPSKIFSDRVSGTQITQDIKRLNLGHGGDGAESGFDSLMDLQKLSWDNSTVRIGFFMGDAPIKGTVGSARHSRGNPRNNADESCPCGTTLADVSRVLEDVGIEIHGLVIGGSMEAKKSFDQFCNSVSPASLNTILNDVISTIQKYDKIYVWSTKELLPVLEGNPRISSTDLSNQFGDNVDIGIEFLNKFGYTEHLLEAI